MNRRPIIAFVLLACASFVAAQEQGDPTTDRELQVILREQETNIRRLKSLRASIVKLKARLEKEGRDHAVARRLSSAR